MLKNIWIIIVSLWNRLFSDCAKCKSVDISVKEVDIFANGLTPELKDKFWTETLFCKNFWTTPPKNRMVPLFELTPELRDQLKKEMFAYRKCKPGSISEVEPVKGMMW